MMKTLKVLQMLIESGEKESPESYVILMLGFMGFFNHSFAPFPSIYHVFVCLLFCCVHCPIRLAAGEKYS